MNLQFSYLLAILLSVSSLNGQVKNQFIRPENALKHHILSGKVKTIPVYRPAQLDVKGLLKEDSLDGFTAGSFRFGKDFDVDIDLVSTALKYVSRDTTHFFYKIETEKAFSINLIFDKFFLSESASLLIYNAERTMVYGPITNTNNPTDDVFWTDLIKGKSIIIQLSVANDDQPKTRLHLAKVIQAYRNLFGQALAVPTVGEGAGFGTSGSCNVNQDIECYPIWQQQANAVAMVITSTGTRKCSGALLNNNLQDFTPNFLTAFHCVDKDLNGVITSSERAESNNWVFRFQYQSSACAGGDGTAFTTVNGSGLLAQYKETDMALLLLKAKPASNVTYAGWTRTATPASSYATIHHPSGDVKKIAQGSTPATTNSSNIGWAGGTQSPPNSHWVVYFNAGAVDGGSSGGPLFNESARVVGQAHGPTGPNALSYSCDLHRTTTPICFGRFDVSWTGGGADCNRLSTWLTTNTSVTQTNTITNGAPNGSLITGPAMVCSNATPTTFTLEISTPGTVTWTTSADLTISSGQGTKTLKVVTNSTANGSNGWVAASINTGCSTIAFPQKSLLVGKTSPPGTLTVTSGSFSNMCVNSQVQVMIAPVPQVVSYSWTSNDPTGLRVEGSGTSALITGLKQSLTALNGYWTFTYSANNACGSNSKNYGVVINNCTVGGGGQQMVTVYPNPASTELNVLIGQDSTKAAAPVEALDIVLINNNLNTVYSVKTSTRLTKIPVGNLPNGNYFLHINNKEGVIERQIVVSH